MTDTKGDRKLPEHVAENRRYWDGMADQWVAAGERGWKTDAPDWGCWNNPETELKLLPDDMSGMRAIELGCGTGYVACWLARRGAEVVGIDNSEKQLATAKRLSAEHAIPITFDWTTSAEDPGGIEFNMPVSSWMRLFRETGFEVLDYLELQAPKGSSKKYGMPGSWAESWPAEQVWKLRRL